MAYLLGQENHPKTSALINDENIQKFMTYYSKDNIDIEYEPSAQDLNIILEDDSSNNEITIKDLTIKLKEGEKFLNKNYYLKIYVQRRTNDSLSFDVKLRKGEVTSNTTVNEQYITTFNVAKGAPEWVIFECIFKPAVEEFDRIVFELRRTFKDYTIAPRYPAIIIRELSIINNYLSKINKNQLFKIGIQSRPNLRTCINNEEIYTNYNGIFEIREGIIPITFFSVVNGIDKDSTLDTYMQNVNIFVNKIDKKFDENSKEEREAYFKGNKNYGTLEDSENLLNNNFIINNKSTEYLNPDNASRTIDAFILDYIYEQ